jgi:hypothetical protein
MIRVLSLLTLSLALPLGFAGPVLAQSVGAPAGIDGATAPGGTEGRAGPRNEAEAIRSGEAIPVPPRAGGVPAEEMPARGTEVPPPPPARP